MYIARHYVRVNGKMFTPGEVITEAIPNDKAIRLAALNAISKMEAAPIQNERGPAPDGKQENSEPEGGKQDADTEKEPDEESVDVEDAQDAEDAEDAEEGEAPVVDVTDGIVAQNTTAQTAQPKAAKPKKRSGKSSAGKRQGGSYEDQAP